MIERLPFLVYRNNSSLDFGLLVTEKGSYNAPERDVTYTPIPGRSGELITDNGRYKNIEIPYKAALLNATERDFSELAHKIKRWLLSDVGYFRLWDSYDRKYFRLASFTEGAEIEQELRVLGEMEFLFNCKPYKYSFGGQAPIELTKPTSLYNPEAFPSKPYIKITGGGAVTLTVNDSAFYIEEIDEYIELEFEQSNAKKGLEPMNKRVSGADMSAFSLRPGDNAISWAGNVERVEITPRWCAV